MESDPASRRQHLRVAGPFKGLRLGMLDTPIYIHELSLGGCLIESHHEERVGSQVQLEIDLPYGGSLTMDSEILYLRPDYGFVVKFINLSSEQQDQLDTAIRRLHAWRANQA